MNKTLLRRKIRKAIKAVLGIVIVVGLSLKNYLIKICLMFDKMADHWMRFMMAKNYPSSDDKEDKRDR